MRKTCTNCKQDKKLSDFQKRGFDRHGRQRWMGQCKDCMKAAYQGKEYDLTQRTCSDCGELKPRAEFHQNSTRKGGFEYICKVCRNGRQTHRNKTTQGRQVAKAGKAAYRARKAMAQGHHTPEQAADRVAYHGSRCYYCGRGDCDLHLDHRIPLARGGSNWASNLVPACPSCNCSKGSQTETEYLEKAIAQGSK